MDTLTEGFVKQDGTCQNSCDNGFVADDSANCVGMLWLQYIPMQGQSTEMDGALKIPYYLIGRALITWMITSRSCHCNSKYKTWLPTYINDPYH